MDVPPDKQDNGAQILADVSVALHEAQEKCRGFRWLSQAEKFVLNNTPAETEAFGADCDGVYVWEHVGLVIV